MAFIFRIAFQMQILKWKVVYFDLNFIEICSRGFDWFVYVSLGNSELTTWPSDLLRVFSPCEQEVEEPCGWVDTFMGELLQLKNIFDSMKKTSRLLAFLDKRI